MAWLLGLLLYSVLGHENATVKEDAPLLNLHAAYPTSAKRFNKATNLQV